MKEHGFVKIITINTLILLIGLALIAYFFPGEIKYIKKTIVEKILAAEEIFPPYSIPVTSAAGMMPDEILGKRGVPLFPEDESKKGGPHDIFGFRNREIPTAADVIVIGDSQTYGLYALIDENWPSVMTRLIEDKIGRKVQTYNMSGNGFGPLQYNYLMQKSNIFTPKVMVLALYMGNDLYEVGSAAKGEYWQSIREKFKNIDPPEIAYGAPFEHRFSDKFRDIFYPQYRLSANNRDLDFIKLGLDYTKRMLSDYSDYCMKKSIVCYFTIIPTKELVYYDRFKNLNIQLPGDYEALVSNEVLNIEEVVAAGADLAKVQYVNVVNDLAAAAVKDIPLYPLGEGHPNKNGYEIIGISIGRAVEKSIKKYVGYATYENGISEQFYYLSDNLAVKYSDATCKSKLSKPGAEKIQLNNFTVRNYMLKKVVEEGCPPGESVLKMQAKNRELN